jgi:hypothetical protein
VTTSHDLQLLQSVMECQKNAETLAAENENSLYFIADFAEKNRKFKFTKKLIY